MKRLGFGSVSLVLGGALFISTVLLGWQAQAVVLLLTDSDNTETKDREEGNWITYYELFRVQNTAHSAIRMPYEELSARVLVSHRDFEKIEHMLSKGEGHTGNLQRVEMEESVRSNGQKLENIIPGFYQLIDPLSYRFYSGLEYFDPDVEHPTNYWLRDLIAARERTKAGKGTHLGPGHDLVKYFLSDPFLAAGFKLMTARGYPDEAIDEVYANKKENGEIDIVPYSNPNGKPLSYWALSHPQFANRWGHSISSKKVGLIEALANQYRMLAPTEFVLDPDGRDQGFYHTIIIQEDNPRHMEKILELVQDIARRGQHKIKFVLRHMGNSAEMAANRFVIATGYGFGQARDVVVTSDGSLRLAKKSEMFVPKAVAATANAYLANACERILERNSERPKKKGKKK